MTTGVRTQVLGWHDGTACTSDYQHVWSKTWNGVDRVPGEPLNTEHAWGADIYLLDRGLCTKLPGSPNASSELVQKCIGGASMHSVTWDPADELKLLGKLADRIRQHEFHAGNALGTAGQTANLIGDRVRSLARGIRALKRGDLPKGIVDAIKGRDSICVRNPKYPACRKRRGDGNLGDGVDYLSGRWLEASYGWRPLLDDVFAGAQALAVLNYSQSIRTFTASHKKSFSYESDPPVSVIPKYKSVYTVKHRIVYTLREELNPLDSLSLVNPAEIAWELLPWSFAIDWVLPVGSWLNSTTLFKRIVGSGYRTSKTLWDGELTSNRPDVYLVHSPCTERKIWYTRTPIHMGNLKVPSLTFKKPWSSSAIRAANQIALLGQLLVK